MVKLLWNLSEKWDETVTVPFDYDLIGQSIPKVTDRDEKLDLRYFALFGAQNMYANGTYDLQWLIDVNDPEAFEKNWDFEQQYGRTQVKIVSVTFTDHFQGMVTWYYYRKPLTHLYQGSVGYHGQQPIA